MSPSKPLRLLLNCANKIQTSKPMINQRGDTYALGFLKTVKVAFQYDKKKYDEFIKVLRDFNAKRIHKNSLKAKVKSLFKGRVDLILEFNKFMPKEHRITPPIETTGKKEKLGEICHLPWDVLDVITQRLDFEDLFLFSGVCRNWRTFHKSNFLSSQKPFLVEISCHPGRGHPSRIISLPNKKVYNLNKMMSYSKFTSSVYVGYSSGYFIILENDYTFMLINPFTRDKKVIYTSSPFELDHTIDQYHGLLAFERCSEEFVLLVLCKKYGSLHVYQSRNNGWVTYFSKGNSEIVLDTVVLNNMTYILTDKGNIGVLSLNSSIIKFLKLKNTPNVIFSGLNLVNCEEQLLVVGLNPDRMNKVVYKIDWSTMSYVELKSLGDIALFYVSEKSCKALSNPNRWGYESNCVYVVEFPLSEYMVYNWNQKWSFKFIELPRPESSQSTYDWCCNLKYELDYSLL